jgi:hypothetical protein
MGRAHAGEVIAGNKPGRYMRLSDDALANLARYFFDQNKAQWGFRDEHFTSFYNSFRAGYRDRLEEYKRSHPGWERVASNPQVGGVNAGRWAQEHYDSASGDARKRAAQLRKLGYRVTVSALGSQVTQYGSLKLTMVDIRPGSNADTEDLPPLPAGVTKVNPSQYDSQHPDLGQAAFDAGKNWRLSGAYSESGVANARVVHYGFLKWYNSLSPVAAKGHRKKTLEGNFREGWNAGKRVERNPEKAQYEIVEHRRGVSPMGLGYYDSWEEADKVARDMSGLVADPNYWIELRTYPYEPERGGVYRDGKRVQSKKKNPSSVDVASLPQTHSFPYRTRYVLIGWQTLYPRFTIEAPLIGDRALREKIRDLSFGSVEWSYAVYARKGGIYHLTRTGVSGVERPMKRNPEDAAAALSESFHGRDPETITTFEEEEHEHEWYAGLGDLVELKVRTVTDLEATIEFPEGKGRPVLAASEDGRQLYIVGGDQTLDLDSLKMSGEKWERDLMTIGEITEFTYRTEKGFDKFTPTDYYHKAGEETGVRPSLLYDPRSGALKVAGGQYQVKPEGVVN